MELRSNVVIEVSSEQPAYLVETLRREAWDEKNGREVEHQRLDHKFVELVTQGRARELKSFFPNFLKAVDSEMGGRHLAILIGGREVPWQASCLWSLLRLNAAVSLTPA